MDMKGEHKISAPREVVWKALNDPDVLKACIPGCQDLTKTSDTGFEATVQAKVGPVKAKFSGAVTLSDIDPPNGYTISGEGKGGAAGFAKGGAKVSLEDDNGETILRYEVDAKVGGKLAQIGSRLIDSTAKKMAGEFFSAFASEVVARDAGEAMNSENDDIAPTSTAASITEAEVTTKSEVEIKPTPQSDVEAGVATAAVTGIVSTETENQDSRSATFIGAENTQNVSAEATASAINAVDKTAEKRGFLGPYIWTLAIIVISGLLIYRFSE